MEMEAQFAMLATACLTTCYGEVFMARDPAQTGNLVYVHTAEGWATLVGVLGKVTRSQ